MSHTPGDHTSNDELAAGIAAIRLHLGKQDKAIAAIKRESETSAQDRRQLNARLATIEAQTALSPEDVAGLRILIAWPMAMRRFWQRRRTKLGAFVGGVATLALAPLASQVIRDAGAAILRYLGW